MRSPELPPSSRPWGPPSQAGEAGRGREKRDALEPGYSSTNRTEFVVWTEREKERERGRRSERETESQPSDGVDRGTDC